MIQKQSLSILSVLLAELHSYAYTCGCFQAFVSACKKSIEVNTCYSPCTVASELCTLHLFSCIISVIASYIITRAVIMTTITLVRRMEVLLELYKHAINHNCLRPHMTYYSSNCNVLFTVVSSFLCFHEVVLLVLYLALELIIVHFTAHDYTCICMHGVTACEDSPAVGLCLKFSSAL